MAALLVVGVLLMVIHHCFYVYLDNRLIQDGFHFDGQGLTNAMGNLIANCARVVLAAAIGIAFVQVLWLYLRRRQHSISQINAFMACSGSPFSPSSIPTWFSPAFFLAIMAFCSTLMTAITVFSPGALTIPSPTMTRNLSCTVYNAEIAGGVDVTFGPDQSGNYGDVFDILDVRTTRIGMIGTYFPPAPSCDGICQYHLDFIAPALECVNITDSIDFNASLPFIPPTTSNPGVVTVWNGTRWDTGYGAFMFQVAAAPMSSGGPGPGEAVNCTVYNATYRVAILQGLNSSTVSLESTQLHNTLPNGWDFGTVSNQTIAQESLVSGLWNVLQGFFSFKYGTTNPVDPNSPNLSVVRRTWIAQKLADGVPIDLMSIIPQMMNDVSISILSGSLDSANLVPYDTTCLYYASFYHYTRWKLLGTYASCIFVATVCSLFGCYAVHANGEGESLGFSRLLKSCQILYGSQVVSAATASIPLDTKLGVTNDGHFKRSTQ